MRIANFRVILAVITLLCAGQLWSQSPAQPSYMNTYLPAEQRAADLVHSMTVKEKVSGAIKFPLIAAPSRSTWDLSWKLRPVMTTSRSLSAEQEYMVSGESA